MKKIKDFLKGILYYLWLLNGYIGIKSRLNRPEKITVLITYYHPIRMEHVNNQIRNLLCCDFVERIVISNHNPLIVMESVVNVKSDRLFVLNQTERHGCGYRWDVARQFSLEHLVVMDDDVLLFPRQLKKLTQFLLDDPNTPHGLAGMVQQKDGSFRYFQKLDQNVDLICEIYALTGKQLKNYIKLRNHVLNDPLLEKCIEFSADFVILSRTGKTKPKIHRVGHILRCPTFNREGIAVHRNHEFLDDVHAVSAALDKIGG